MKKTFKDKANIIAEMAASHEGDVEIGTRIIKGVKDAGADGILFQIINLDTYIVPSDADYEDIKSFSLSKERWRILFDQANLSELDVWANVYDLESAKFCRGLKLRGFKLHSANLENEALLREIAKSGKELLLSVGGVEKEEIRRILRVIRSLNRKTVVYLMYGLQNFPTNPESVNASYIKELSMEMKLPFGYQDHSEPASVASIYLPVLFLAEGARVIEKHITHDRSLKGQDHEAALNPDEFKDFVMNVRIAEKVIYKDPEEVSEDELKYKEYKTLMKVVAVKEISAGEVLSNDNLAIMRSRAGEISGRDIGKLIGKKASKSYKRYEPIKRDEFLKVGIFITARLKSTRLPMKVIKPIMGKPMIEWMVERLKRCGISPIVLMTSTNPQDDPLVEIARKNQIKCFRGSEDDVLLRMRDCANEFDRDLILSVTADDPLKEPIFMQKMVRKYMGKEFDFCEIEGLPNGCESYAVSRKGLERVCGLKKDSNTEIWGNYFRKGKFKCEIIRVDDPNIFRPNYRITVDTPEDFSLVSEIFEILLKGKEYFNVYDVCKLLDKRPDLVKINAKIKQVKAPRIKI